MISNLKNLEEQFLTVFIEKKYVWFKDIILCDVLYLQEFFKNRHVTFFSRFYMFMNGLRLILNVFQRKTFFFLKA
ncbi:hypothetical protein DD595_26505 [Enterobacter cloacae complex sp. 4DZ3-17B2]|nr:hypothetical protein DD595_26505 [Enterobacter cloacae complex sp. 4DZ3-17B2]